MEREAQTPEKEKKKAVRRAGNMDVKKACDGNISDQYDTINAKAHAGMTCPAKRCSEHSLGNEIYYQKYF